MNVRNRNRSVVAAHSLSLDTRLCLDSLRWQFCRCRRLKPKPPRRPPRPRRRPRIPRSLVPSGVRNGERGALNGVRNDERDAQSGVRSGAQDARSDGTRATAPPPPSKKSNRSFGPTRQSARLSAGRRKAVQRAASAGPSYHGTVGFRTTVAAFFCSRDSGRHRVIASSPRQSRPRCPLTGAQQTSRRRGGTSVFDPERTFANVCQCHVLDRVGPKHASGTRPRQTNLICFANAPFPGDLASSQQTRGY